MPRRLTDSVSSILSSLCCPPPCVSSQRVRYKLSLNLLTNEISQAQVVCRMVSHMQLQSADQQVSWRPDLQLHRLKTLQKQLTFLSRMKISFQLKEVLMKELIRSRMPPSMIWSRFRWINTSSRRNRPALTTVRNRRKSCKFSRLQWRVAYQK